MSKRLRYVDVARGFTMLCVILGHMEVGIIRTIIFSFHMPLFFLLSGYFQTKKSTGDFMKNKSRSLLIPYLFTGICVMFCAQLKNIAKLFSYRGITKPAKYLLIEWIKAIVLGSGNKLDVLWVHADLFIGAIWFLLALFEAQLLVNLFSKINFWFLYIVAIASFGIISAQYFWLPLSIQAGAAASVYVALGYIYKHQKWTGDYLKIQELVVKIKNRNSNMRINNGHVDLPKKQFMRNTLDGLLNQREVFIICMIIWTLYLYVSYRLHTILALVNASFALGPFDYLGSTAAAIVVLFVCYHVFDKIPIVNSFLSWFGENSIIILCFHLIELKCVPFKKIIEFVLSEIGLNSFIWECFFTFAVKVLYCCTAIILVHRVRFLSGIFQTKKISQL